MVSWAIVAHPFNPSTQEAEAGRFLSVQSQPALQIEFQDSQGYTERPCLRKKNLKKGERLKDNQALLQREKVTVELPRPYHSNQTNIFSMFSLENPGRDSELWGGRDR